MTLDIFLLARKSPDNVACRWYTYNTRTKEAIVRARIEPELKEAAETILRRMGMTTAEAIRLFMNQICPNNGFPYPLRVPTAEMQNALEETENYEQLSSYDDHRELRKELGV